MLSPSAVANILLTDLVGRSSTGGHGEERDMVQPDTKWVQNRHNGRACDGRKLTSDQEVVGSSPTGGASPSAPPPHTGCGPLRRPGTSRPLPAPGPPGNPAAPLRGAPGWSAARG